MELLNNLTALIFHSKEVQNHKIRNLLHSSHFPLMLQIIKENLFVSLLKIKLEIKLLKFLEKLIFQLQVALVPQALQVPQALLKQVIVEEVEEVPLSKKTTVQMEITLLATMMEAVVKIPKKMSISPNLQKSKSMKIMIFSILRQKMESAIREDLISELPIQQILSPLKSLKKHYPSSGAMR